MSKLKKSKPNRTKSVRQSPTYTTLELMERYHCGRRTLRRWVATRGFPAFGPSGKHKVTLKSAVHAWEEIHMPWLHVDQLNETPEQAAEWKRLHKRWQLEKDLDVRPPPKAKPGPRARA